MAVLRCCAVCATPSPGPYCEAHQPKPWQGSRHRERLGLSGSAWDKLRRSILKRDQGVCYLCDQLGATEVDHLIELAAGGTNDQSNLASAHGDCHRRKHSDPDWAAERVAHALETLRVPRVPGGRLRPVTEPGIAVGERGAGAERSDS